MDGEDALKGEGQSYHPSGLQETSRVESREERLQQ